MNFLGEWITVNGSRAIVVAQIYNSNLLELGEKVGIWVGCTLDVKSVNFNKCQWDKDGLCPSDPKYNLMERKISEHQL